MRYPLILLIMAFLIGCGSDDQPETGVDNNAKSDIPDAGSPQDMALDADPIIADASSESDADAETVADLGSADMSDDVEPDLGNVTADVAARLLYINQQVFREDEFFARGGTAVVEFVEPQDLPPDDRTEFFNADGERCTFESGTEWPISLPGGGTWPAGPFQNGGDVSLTAAGAPGPVVYGHLETYYVRKEPGSVMLGNITHSSFFPPEYIPHGATASLSTAGGPDVGGFQIDDLALAADYTVASPDLETGNDVIDANAALPFVWSPASPGDRMAVIVKDSFSYIKCVFDDDGEATVPADAMQRLNGGQFVRFTVQTWREHTASRQVKASDGKIVDVDFTSRHVQIGRFDTE